MVWSDPYWLWLMPVVVVVVAWPWLRGYRRAVPYSATALLSGVRPSAWARCHWLPGVLRGVAVTLFVAALARPQLPARPHKRYGEGIAIQMLVDRSGSMRVPDFVLNDKPVSRLDAVKDVFSRFVRGDGTLPGRPNDLVGLVTFANLPETECPLTLSHDVLVNRIRRLQAARAGDDGTNIGDAVAWALGELQQCRAKSKVIVLLTDGVNEPALLAGLPEPLEPLEAARVAEALGVKLYTIGAGGSGGVFAVQDHQSHTVNYVRAEPVNERLLQQMARITGGRYFRATSADGLARICHEIDRLEKSRTEAAVHWEYRELFWPFALLGLLALCGEQVLSATRLRRVP